MTATATAIEAATTSRFEYKECVVKDLTAIVREGKTKPVVDAMVLNNERFLTGDRFWTSIQARFGFSSNIFTYFSHAEVFDRINKVAPSDKLVCCIERSGDGETKDQLLACSSPTKPVVKYDDLMEVIHKNGLAPDVKNPITYNNGVVQSSHAPKFTIPFDIRGDKFHNRFVLDCPIDGYGKPSIYLMMLREVCVNGAIAMAPVFRSQLSLGKGDDDFCFPISRALDGFNSEDGYSALKQRFESAQMSWASVNETQKLYKTLVRIHSKGELRNGNRFQNAGGDGAALMESSPIIRSFNTMVGDITQAYGLANLDALSVKRQRTLPTPCRVYDLINFASEVATHNATPAGALALNGYLGDLINISNGEYDLEGTAEKYGDWRDFLVLDTNAIDTKMVLDGSKK